MKLFRQFALPALLSLASSAGAASTVFIPAGQYFNKLTAAVDQASSSVTGYMYVYSLYVDNDADQPSRLADALVAAAARGVQVELILNGPSSWVGQGAQDDMDDKNRAAAEFLTARGVRVYFETTPALLQAKVVIIDDAQVLLGSTNWSRKAFSDNIEADLLVRDPVLAREIRAALAAVPRAPFVSADADAVRLPASLLTPPGGLGLMTRRKDGTAFDIYVWLLKESQSTGAPAVLKVDLDALAAHLGKTGNTRGGRRTFVSRNLRSLQNRYKLLSVTLHDGADAEVVLAPLAGETVFFARDYWTHGWDRRPNEYLPNPFYDFDKRVLRRAQLAEDHGREKVDRASRIAAEFYEDWDLDAVQSLIALEDDHGRDKVDRAVRRVAALRPDNPKRNISYLIAAIKNPERPAPPSSP